MKYNIKDILKRLDELKIEYASLGEYHFHVKKHKFDFKVGEDVIRISDKSVFCKVVKVTSEINKGFETTLGHGYGSHHKYVPVSIMKPKVNNKPEWL